MKENIKEEKILFNAQAVIDVIWSKILTEYIKRETIESIDNSIEKQKWFAVTCPIEYTLKEKNIDYRIIVADKTYYDVNFKELYKKSEEYGLSYYINEENIKFYISREDLDLLFKHKKMLEEGLSPLLVLKRVRENIPKSN